MNAGSPELTVVVPTRNERDNITPLLARLRGALGGIRWEVIFVDDDSPDRTAEVVRELGVQDVRVRLIERLGERGLASACVAGVAASAAPQVAVMDADLQHDVRLLPQMLRRLQAGGLDVVVASRYVAGGSLRGLPPRRARLSRLAVHLARAFPRVRLADPMSGFFAIRRAAFDAALPRLSQLGFKILLDLLLSAPRPLRCVEIPYQLAQRHHGASKLDTPTLLQFAVLLTEKLAGRFIPLSLVLFVCVGGSGLLVHVAALYVLVSAGAVFATAQSGAVLAAMTSNFLLNNLVTYRDLRLRGWRWLRGLVSFYAVCCVGAVANVSLASLVYRATPRWWLAGLSGAALGAAWNYLASRGLTWQSWPRAARGRRPQASARPTRR
ncbi:MAG TPA: glycosyltransferase family 2 protein [Steroidobacteraceae bacterium]|jgi:dolichol-phosphate mannosyltransferase|nr:glycosyltransferase family 2 protein [Steroidobacteraceae bacterium]